jgi:hypothetical protein
MSALTTSSTPLGVMAVPCPTRPVPDMRAALDCGRRSAARKARAALRSGLQARGSLSTTVRCVHRQLPRPDLALHGPKPTQLSSAREHKNGRECQRRCCGRVDRGPRPLPAAASTRPNTRGVYEVPCVAKVRRAGAPGGSSPDRCASPIADLGPAVCLRRGLLVSRSAEFLCRVTNQPPSTPLRSLSQSENRGASGLSTSLRRNNVKCVLADCAFRAKL